MIESLAAATLEERERVLTQSLAHFRNPPGPDLLRRADRFGDYIGRRERYGLWPYARALEAAAGPRTAVSDSRGDVRQGLNFASQDYLGLSGHPKVRQAAIEAVERFGVHSAGSAVLVGNTRLSRDLEDAIGAMLRMPHVALYPTGWAAGYAAITAFVRPRDHVVLDYLSHACLQQGAAAATTQIHPFEHNSVDDLRAKLAAIRGSDTKNGIMVVTEGLFSMDSDVPDLRALQQTAHAFGATLLVDVAHDFGSMGPGGGGSLAAQSMLGEVDLVMGSFSKTFASNGGFVACRNDAVRQYARYFANPHMFSNALSPIQAAVVAEALEIVRSEEGDRRRADLMRAIGALRDAFVEAQWHPLGVPSPIVPIPFGNDRLARIAARHIAEQDVFVNLVEYPAVPAGGARLRLQVMADHTPDQARTAARKILAARAYAEGEMAGLSVEA